MSTPIQVADLAALRTHLPLFAVLLFSLPPVSFLTIKVLLLTTSASKHKVTKQWYVTRDEDDGGRAFYHDPDAEERGPFHAPQLSRSVQLPAISRGKTSRRNR